MYLNFRKPVGYYFDSRWLPGVVALSGLFLAVATLIIFRGLPVPILYVLLAIILISVGGVVAAAIWNSFKRRWKTVAAQLAFIPLYAFALYLALMALIGASGRGDGFADDLVIPDNIEVAEPQPINELSRGDAEDTFQTAMFAAASKADSGDPTVTAALPSLVKLHSESPEILKRYFASSPAWRLYSDKGSQFATRRWKMGPYWTYPLNGYYGRYNFEHLSDPGYDYFQTRLTIGFGGKPWAQFWDRQTEFQVGETKDVSTVTNSSQCVITDGDLVVEIFDESPGVERRLTRAALKEIESEFAPLAANPTWETIRSLLPRVIQRGKLSMTLRSNMSPATYDTEIWVNPGEPGMIYLKAFEVTQGTALSSKDLKKDSNEWVGWSDNPEEMFLSNSSISIDEGDFGKYYAARFEVWFTPDSGAPERKLVEKIFKIEGWQR